MSGEYPREWFRVNRWDDEPFARMFDRETDAFLIRDDGRRDKKWTNYERWYPTREEAQAVIDERKANTAERKRMDRIRDAAPDMLAALEVVCSSHRASLYPAEFAQARAAIAKALGRTPNEIGDPS
jgi:hypothetical protein